MNAIKKINQLNRQELENNVLDRASWHYERRDTNYIYIGGLPSELKEYDVLVIFSQYGIPTHINLVKNEETGELKGFGYLKYNDFRSCVLAIDNLNGIKLLDLHYLRVDHANYRLPKGKEEDDFKIDYSQYVETKNTGSSKMIKLFSEAEQNDHDPLENMKQNDDDELRDPISDIKQTNVDELKDPLSDVKQNDSDEELKDPMANFIEIAKTETKKRSYHAKSSSRKKQKENDKKAELFLADIFQKSKKDNQFH